VYRITCIVTLNLSVKFDLRRLTYELDIDRVKVNKHTPHGHFVLKDTQTHTHTSDRSLHLDH